MDWSIIISSTIVAGATIFSILLKDFLQAKKYKKKNFFKSSFLSFINQKVRSKELIIVYDDKIEQCYTKQKEINEK